MQVITNQKFYTVFIFHHNKQHLTEHAEIDISKDVSLSIHLVTNQLSIFSNTVRHGYFGNFFHEMLGGKAVNIKLHAMPGGEGGGSQNNFMRI